MRAVLSFVLAVLFAVAVELRWVFGCARRGTVLGYSIFDCVHPLQRFVVCVLGLLLNVFCAARLIFFVFFTVRGLCVVLQIIGDILLVVVDGFSAGHLQPFFAVREALCVALADLLQLLVVPPDLIVVDTFISGFVWLVVFVVPALVFVSVVLCRFLRFFFVLLRLFLFVLRFRLADLCDIVMF
ncbi:hypothetical protein [Escherichia coli]|uniref:hypothetical protein n=1 Tax=Escherichia coli TaxID=562 RepID=UPI001BA4ABC9|nr:hypothetical protein [Escherichia coli]